MEPFPLISATTWNLFLSKCLASRKAAELRGEPPQSPGSLLYVLYVLYGSCTPTRGTPTVPRLLAICAICTIWLLHANPLNPHTLRAPCYCAICAIWLLHANPLNPLRHNVHEHTRHDGTPGLASKVAGIQCIDRRWGVRCNDWIPKSVHAKANNSQARAI